MAGIAVLLLSSRECSNRSRQLIFAATISVWIKSGVIFVQAGGATSTGPAAGSGHEIILQAFNWESWREDWYKVLSRLRTRTRNDFAIDLSGIGLK